MCLLIFLEKLYLMVQLIYSLHRCNGVVGYVKPKTTMQPEMFGCYNHSPYKWLTGHIHVYLLIMHSRLSLNGFYLFEVFSSQNHQLDQHVPIILIYEVTPCESRGYGAWNGYV